MDQVQRNGTASDGENGIQTAKLLMPDWTEKDFYDDTVVDWLWKHRSEDYAFTKVLAATQRLARELKVNAFTKMWNAYLKAMSPKHNVIGINATDFPDQPTQLRCCHYICDYEGVHYENMMGGNVWVCKHPIMPVKRIVNVDTGNESTEVAFKRGKQKWRELIVSSEVLASSQKVIALAKSGIGVNSENAKELVKYMTDLVSENIDEMPVQNSTSHLGWLPDGEFVPYAKDIEYDGESAENMRMFEAFTPKGSYDLWLETAKATRSGNSVAARIALAGAFAAPLVSKLNGLPFIIHLYGASGMGKSVALMLSASVWADPNIGTPYIKTFGGTKVSHELTAAFCCNVPMYIDELQIQADRKSFDDLIYMLCEGTTKGRGAKDGGLQTQKRWSNCILTTGEGRIVKDNSGGGAAVRCIEVDYGGTPLFEDGHAVSNILKLNYGHAGHRFVEAIKDSYPVERLKKIMDGYFTALSSGDIHGKQILSAAILLTADQVADEVIFRDGHSLTVDEVKPFLTTNKQASKEERCYNWLMGVIASNPKRFETEDNNGEVWGTRDGEVVYIIRSVFDRILNSNEFDPHTFLPWAKREGKIKCEQHGKNSNNNRLTKRVTVAGHVVTCVALIMDETIEVEDDDMPFMDD